MPAQHWPFTWASFKQVWLLLVHIMQNLSKGYVHKDLSHCGQVWMPRPWKHSKFQFTHPGWMGLWHPDLLEDVLADCRRVGLYRSLPTQTLLGFRGASQPDCGNSWWLFAAIAPVPSALQLNEIKTSFDMYKQYCRLMVFLHHIWWSRLGDFKYNSLANCASGNWVLMYFYVTVHIESYLFAAKECQLYISLLFHFLNYWAVSVYILPSFLQFSVHQWTPRQPPKTPKIPPNFKYRCLNVFLSKI